MQRLQVLGGVRGRLLARAGELLDRPRCLGEQVEQLEAAYLVTDHTRAEEPWLVLTGDALRVGDAGRPDLHAHGDTEPEDMARTLYRSIRDNLLTLPDHLVLYPAHYSGSVCGRRLSANPTSTIGFERAHNRALAYDSEEAFVTALLDSIPPAPARQAEIVAVNRAGRPLPVAR